MYHHAAIAEVLKLPMQGVSIHVSGTGIQAAGRLVRIEPLSAADPSAKVGLGLSKVALISGLIVVDGNAFSRLAPVP